MTPIRSQAHSSSYSQQPDKAEIGHESSAPRGSEATKPSRASKLLEYLAPLTSYAAQSTLPPALVNTPVTTSLSRPLVISQHEGKMPLLKGLFSTKGWTPALGRTTVRFALADSARASSQHLIDGLLSSQPELNEHWRNSAVDTTAAMAMTLASQPLTAMQVHRQIAKKEVESPFVLYRQLLAHPFRGSGSNFFATLVMFGLDRNDRYLIEQNKNGNISQARMWTIQGFFGGMAGVANNFLKTHANDRALGFTHQHIFQKVAETARKQPTVFALQIAYGSILGGIANRLWSSSISVMQNIDSEVKRRLSIES